MLIRCKLRKVLAEKGLTQTAVALGAGVTPGAVGRMYGDKLSRLDTTTLDKVTDFLGITDITEIFELVPNDGQSTTN